MPPAARGSFEKPSPDPTKLLSGKNFFLIECSSPLPAGATLRAVLLARPGNSNDAWKHYLKLL